MDIEGKALYNLLRMNWLENPDLLVEPWQVEDYRSLSNEELEGRLSSLEFRFDKAAFIGMGEEVESPEALADILIGDKEIAPQQQDQIYLLVFELWRRYLPEKASISIFCDELDTQIFHYDRGFLDHLEDLQDVVSNLKVILDENTDHGQSPIETFQAIGSLCANDLESFLYDFTADQIDSENESYAEELIDDFYDFIEDSIWFDLLKARLLSLHDEEAAHHQLLGIIEEVKENPSPEFLLELLAFTAQGGDPEIFIKVVQMALKVIETEDDFKEILHLSEDFCDYFDFPDQQEQVHALIKEREKGVFPEKFSEADAFVSRLLKILYSASGLAKQ